MGDEPAGLGAVRKVVNCAVMTSAYSDLMTLPVAGSARTVLVVDDEATIRDVIRRYLERDGFVVREAGDGFAALDALSEALPDLIVLDLMLPGIDGLTLTRQLRTPKPGGE